MKKAPYLSARFSNSSRPRVGGFTLVELLVSIAILSVIMVLLAQVMQETGLTIQSTSRTMETTELCLAALDRIDSNLSGMVTTGSATLVAMKNTTGSDGLALITNGRVRSRISSPTDLISVNSPSAIRMGAMGYCVANTADPDLTGAPVVPMLNWGNGTVTWTPAENASSVNNVPQTALSRAVTDINTFVGTGTAPATTTSMLQFQSLSKGIFRLEICFLLSNGTLISVTPPPLNQNITVGASAYSNQSNYALAFNANDSNTAGVYVRALVIGVAAIDSTTQKLLTTAQLASLPNALAKTIDKQTPLQAWDISNSSTPTYISLQAYPAQVLQNIRFFQRYFYVN